MKKNISVNLKGYLFNIDEDAFELLNSYLDRLKKHFKNDAGSNEIIDDIEDRIAELLREKLSVSKVAITISDVQDVIKIMGDTTQFDKNEGQSEDSKNSDESDSETNARRLYRDPDEKIVAGVASGIAAYFSMDPLWIRLAFVALFFMSPGLLIYILLWIVIPEAKNTAQKLEMRGMPINIENIEKTIKDEFEGINEKFKDFKEKNFSKRKNEPNVFERIASALIQVFAGLVRVIGIFVGILFTVIALVIIIVLIPSFFHTDGFFVVGNSNILMFSMENFFELVFNSKSDVYMTLTALAIVIGMPLVGMINQGVKLIFGIKRKNYFLGTSFLIVWLTGFLLLIISGIKISNNYKYAGKEETLIECNEMVSDTLFIEIQNPINLVNESIEEEDVNFLNSSLIYMLDSTSFYGLPKFIINKNAQEFNVIVRKESMGKSYKYAKKLANDLTYSFHFEDSLLQLSPYFRAEKSKKWRVQRAEIEINIPEGKHIKLINRPNLNQELQAATIDESSSFFLFPDGKDFIIRDRVGHRFGVFNFDSPN